MSVLDTAALERFVADDPNHPVVMLNLIEFAAGGAAKYAEYIEKFGSSGIQERYGVQIVYAGAGHASLVPGKDSDWDLVALFAYPSRQHFVDMINDPDYASFEHLRVEAVSTLVLQPTTQGI